MKNGIVILNYNDYVNTSLILDNIKDFAVLDYIIIVDNNSTDESVKVLKKYENKKIKLLINKENKGYAYGNNVGVKYLINKCKVDNIIISNPDIIVKEDVIKKLLQDLKKKDVAIVAPVIVEPEDVSRGWKLPTFKSELLSNLPYFNYLANELLEYDEHYYDDEFSAVDVVKGCFFIVKANVFKKIGFFDEHTFLFYEEVIIAKKLYDLGYKTLVDNSVSVYHASSITISKNLKRMKKFKILKDSQKYFVKQVMKFNSFQIFLIRFCYYFNYIISYIYSLLMS